MSHSEEKILVNWGLYLFEFKTSDLSVLRKLKPSVGSYYTMFTQSEYLTGDSKILSLITENQFSPSNSFDYYVLHESS